MYIYQWGIPQKMLQENKVIELLNAVGEHNTLRNSIIPGLLKNLSQNQHHEYPQNLFEVGKIFTSGDTETGVQETHKLGLVLCHEKTDFTEIKQILGILCESLGLQYSVTEHEQSSCIMGRSGQIIINNKKIGFIGEIHPQVLTNWELIVPVVVLELNVEKLLIKK